MGPVSTGNFINCYHQKKLLRFIDIGSYGLHVLNLAFKTAAETTGWNIKRLLKGPFLNI